MAERLGKLGRGRSALRLLQRSEYDRAQALYHRALALAQESAPRPLVAHCHVGRGKLHGTVGRRADPGAELTVGRDLYRTIDMPYWLSPAEAAPAPTPPF